MKTSAFSKYQYENLKIDFHLQTVIKTYTVLGHFGFHVTRSEVSQSTDSWFCDFFTIPSIHNGADQSVDATDLMINLLEYFIKLVV